MALFRAEAARHQDRLHGDVSLVPPLSWQALGLFLSVVLVIAAVFLSLAGYAQTAQVAGTIESSRGVISVAAQRAGTVLRLRVQEGAHVVAGQPLLTLDLATHAGDIVLEERRRVAIDQERAALARRLPALDDESQARIAGLEASISADQASLVSLAAREADQQALIALAREDLERAKALEGRGFISRSEIGRREETLFQRRQAQAELEEGHAERLSHIASARAEIEQERAAERAATADVERAQGSVAGIAAQDGMQRELLVTAPVAGIVIGQTAHPGDTASPMAPLLSIIPDGAQTYARLTVPPSAAGFIAVGEPARLAIDSFPREVYGTVAATIIAITPAAVVVPSSRSGPAFLADARLHADTVNAYGSRYALRPGMTLTARITTRRQSLVEWLLDPLFAVRGR